MQFIGNIVTKTIFEDTDVYNVVDDIIKIMPSIPTLIIGWNLTKSYFPDADILEPYLGNNIYWTFGKRERRDVMEVDIAKFKEKALSIISKSINYSYFNPLTANTVEKRVFLNDLNSEEEKSCYITDEMTYICFTKEKKIIGISLRDIAYEKGNYDKFLDTLKQNKNVKIITDNYKHQNIKYLLKNNKYLLSYVFS